MTWIIGDSFDFYATMADAGAAFWDSSVSADVNLTTGRFTGSQAIGNTFTQAVFLTKSSGSNDATHHIVCAFEQTVGLSGTTLGLYFQLLDTTTGQVCVVFRTDGAILLTSGTPSGTVLATYTGAFSANVWTAFEIEITINNTTGAFHVRTNGAASDSFAATGLNTRPGTNAYANKLQVGLQSSSSPITTNAQKIDDLLWFSTSGSAPNTWVGDIRAVQLMPAADTAQKQFTQSASTILEQISTSTVTGGSCYSGSAYFAAITASANGVLSALSANLSSSATGHMQMALYDATGTGGGPGTLLATGAAITNPTSGVNSFTVTSGPTISKGTVYWIGVLADTTVTILGSSTSISGQYLTKAYSAGFPSSAAGFSSYTLNGFGSCGFTVPASNSGLAGEFTEDGDATYVYSSTATNNDLYSVVPLPTSPASIVAVQTRGFAKKTDAGARSGQVQLVSGSATVTSTATALATSYSTLSRVDTVDPNTSAAWTASGVNAITIGPVVQA